MGDPTGPDKGTIGHGGKRVRAGRPRTSTRDDVAVKLDRGVAVRARFVANVRGISLAEYLTEAIRPLVDRNFKAAAQGMP